MAVVWLAPPYTGTISAANDYQLPCPFPGVVCRWVISLVGTFSGTVTVKARPSGSAVAFAAIPYIIVSTEASATAALTAAAWISVDATARDIDLDCDPYTSGSLAIIALPVIG